MAKQAQSVDEAMELVELHDEHGWMPLVRFLIDVLLRMGGSVAQVKSKFGGLRFYWDQPFSEDGTPLWSDEQWRYFLALQRAVENLTLSLSEQSGLPGAKQYFRGVDGKGKWITTLLPSEAEAAGFDTRYYTDYSSGAGQEFGPEEEDGHEPADQ